MQGRDVIGVAKTDGSRGDFVCDEDAAFILTGPSMMAAKSARSRLKVGPPRAEDDDVRTTVMLITKTDKREDSGSDC